MNSRDPKDEVGIQNFEIQSLKIHNVESIEKSKNDPDADRINDIIRSYAKQMRKMGRYTAFSLIAASWTVSYHDGYFIPSDDVKKSFLFAVIYLIADYLYLFFIVKVYKWMLRHYYISIREGGFVKKDNMDSYNASRIVSWIGTVLQILTTISLGLAAFFMIKHIVSL